MKPNISDETRRIARSAAQWLALVESGAASEQELAKLQSWRDEHISHEKAWQKAQLLKQRFAELPSPLAMASLDRPTPNRRQVLKGLLGISVVTPAVWVTSQQLPIAAWQADLSTRTGERRQVSLADGSLLDLNTATAVNIDISRRYLQLVQGEVALRVAGIEPFTIDTVNGEALLNQGDMCIRQIGDESLLSVSTGFAYVYPRDQQPLKLQAGQQVRIAMNQVGSIRPFDVDQSGWRDGVMVADNQRLGDFLRDLDRYRPGLLYWSQALESLRVTGTFKLDDTDRILALLAASLPLDIISRTRYWVTLVPRKKSA